MQAVPTYFSNILADTAMDDSTASVDWAEYRTSDLNISNGDSQTSDYYQIVVKDTDQYVLMSQAYLQVQAKLVSSADASVADGQIVTMGAAGASLFQRMELLANDSQIDICENPQFVQLVNALTNYSKDKLESVAESEWLMLDFADKALGPQNGAALNAALAIQGPEFSGTAAQVWEHGSGAAVIRQWVRSTAATANNAGSNMPLYNTGYAARWNRSRNARVFELIIPLASVFGFCRDIRSVHRGIKWELNLQKNIRYPSLMHGNGAVNDTIVAAATLGAKTLIKKVSLWVPQITPSLETTQMLEQTLSQSVISKQYFENMTCRYSEEYPSGTVEVEWLLPLEGHKPTKIMFGFQRQRQYKEQNDIAMQDATGLLQLTDQTHANPSTFSTLCSYNVATKLMTGGITEAELRVNTKSLPREKYKISFTDANPEYERLYVDFLKSTGKFQDESGSAVSYKDYKDLYPIIAFDLRDYADVFSGLKNNDIRFRARVSAGSPDAFRLVAVIYSERELIVQPISGKLSLKV
jgi:hypothetical protein